MALKPGAYKKEVKQLLSQSDIILNQRWIAVDPASKIMGYAIVDKGEITKSGTIEAKHNAPIGIRLQVMYEALHNMGIFELLAIEKVRQPKGHFMLVWSAGVASGGVGARFTCEVPTNLWKQAADDAYFKDDEQDAIYIAKYCLELCRGKHQ